MDHPKTYDALACIIRANYALWGCYVTGNLLTVWGTTLLNVSSLDTYPIVCKNIKVKALSTVVYISAK